MATATFPDTPPMAEMNTTPLIDVLLVLLIMFILSVPVASHVTPVELPGPGPIEPARIRPENRLSVTAQGTMTWNGAPIGEARLSATLAALVHLKPEPLVKFQPEAGAPYGVSARAINLVKTSGLASFAFVGTEQYARFDKAAPAR
ncbi:MAG: ExbD/TolR family protein [Novosphingobium sp.]